MTSKKMIVSFLMLFCMASVAAVSVVNPCAPTPCGPNSQCRQLNGGPVCSCKIGYLGAPPSCRACASSSDCAADKACFKHACQDPCQGSCGINAKCKVVNHAPICSCPDGYQGDAFASCSRKGK